MKPRQVTKNQTAMTFKTLFQTPPTHFLELSNEPGQPFVIPDVSPVSSPNLAAVPANTVSVDEALGVPKEAAATRERSMSVIELN